MHMVLLGTTIDHYWQNALREALTPLGRLDVMTPEQVAASGLDGKYDLVAVDATHVEDVEQFVSRLRAECPERRIVVLSAAPTWQSARAAFEAGAMDYLPKDLDKRNLLKTFRELGQKQPPPWPRWPMENKRL
jgi:DNA-binding response OmpR family regulator